MGEVEIPRLLEPDELERRLGADALVVVDLCRDDLYGRFHVPGAVHLSYPRILSGIPPAVGDLPEEERLAEALGAAGITPQCHVVAYDDEGGGKAARLLWTLDMVGHRRWSLLNGGLHAWVNEHHPVEQHLPAVPPAHYPVSYRDEPYADLAYVVERLHDAAAVLVDARSADEYHGRKRFSHRAGHIPGAVNIDWLLLMDQGRNLRLKEEAELRRLFEASKVVPEREAICYCQTHHRSSLTYVALRLLGYPQVKGYAGAWAEWGNALDTPIEA